MAFKTYKHSISFSGKNHKYIGIYGKPKAHSLVCGRVVTPLSRVTALVIGIGLTYMRNNYKNVNLKHITKLGNNFSYNAQMGCMNTPT